VTTDRRRRVGAALDAVAEQAPMVRLAGPGDEGAVVELLATTFAHDPLVGWIVGSDPDGRRRRAFFRMCFQLRDLGAGEVLVTPDLQAAFTWNLSESSPVGLIERARQLPNFLAFADWGRVARLLGFFAALEARRPAEPHVYTQFLGVAPALQRSGIGGRLMRCATATADRLGRPTYGETSRPVNVDVWGRSGFVASEPLVLVPGSPVCWPLLRPPGGGRT
jgi:GNAT superfamily N-acetyltransferase